MNNGTVSQDPQGQINFGYIESPDAVSDYKSNFIPIIPDEVKLSAFQFQRRQKKGFIDVWWLYDDGGEIFIFFNSLMYILYIQSHFIIKIIQQF